MIVGIVGSEAAKFTLETEGVAKNLIWDILTAPGVTGYSSGHCHLGGIDIWTEEIGKELGLKSFVFAPVVLGWELGYKPRNLQIVKFSDEVHCIIVRHLPPSYNGMEFTWCYHCKTKDHVKSGGCWTALQAQKQGKPAYWHVLGE